MEKVRRGGIRFLMDKDFGAVSVSDGSFRAVGLKPGSKRFWTGSIDYLYSCSDPVEVVIGREVVGVDFVLDDRPREQLIECLVLDPEGNPAKGVSVRLRYKNGSSGLKGRDQGRFVCRVKKEKSPYSLEAIDPEGRWERVRLEDVKPGASNLVLQFTERAKKLRLVVSSKGPAPVDAFTVAAWTRSLSYLMKTRGGIKALGTFGGDDHYVMTTFSQADRSADGAVTMDLPDSDFFVTVHARGYGIAERGPFSRKQPPDLVEVTLDPVLGLSGRVVSGDGGVEGARVSLYRQVDPRQPINVIGFNCRSERNEADGVATGPGGSFVLYPTEPGPFFLRAVKEGFAPAESGLLDLDPQQRREVVDLVLTPGGSIAGRVIMAPGRDPSGTVVGASRGDGYPVVACVGRDGAFRFDHLIPGPWCVEKRSEYELDESRWAQRQGFEDPGGTWSCTVVEGETTTCDLDLSYETVTVLQGRIVVKDLLSGSWDVTLSPLDPGPQDRGGFRGYDEDSVADVSRDGSFTLKTLVAGRHILQLCGWFRPGRKLRIEELIDLTGGETTWEWSVPLATIEISPPPPDFEGMDRLMYCWKGEGERIAYMDFDADPKASVKLHPVPAGRFRIVQWGNDPREAPLILLEGKAVSEIPFLQDELSSTGV